MLTRKTIIYIACALLISSSLAISSYAIDLNRFQGLHTSFQSISSQDSLDLNKLLTKLRRAENRSDEKFLADVFYKTHKKFLKTYNANSSTAELFSNGEYDCVSGSILYNWVLTELDIAHQIIETDYHVFIIVERNQKEYIFEATDALYGFISDPEKIEAFKLKYTPKEGSLGLRSGSAIGAISALNEEEQTIYNSISASQLSGLQYYNNGIDALHHGNYEKAVKEFEKALIRYNSIRIQAVYRIAQSLIN